MMVVSNSKNIIYNNNNNNNNNNNKHNDIYNSNIYIYIIFRKMEVNGKGEF